MKNAVVYDNNDAHLQLAMVVASSTAGGRRSVAAEPTELNPPLLGNGTTYKTEPSTHTMPPLRPNPLILEFNTQIEPLRKSTKRNQPFKRQRQQFFLLTLSTIQSKILNGGDTTDLYLLFFELVKAKGSQHDMVQLRFQRGVYEGVPSRAELAAQEFGRYMGDENKLENWMRLCRDLGFEPVPESLTKCRKAAKTVYVNIYDFLDQVMRSGPPATHFKDVFALRDYSKANDKVFPLEVAKREARENKSALIGLLQPIFRAKEGWKPFSQRQRQSQRQRAPTPSDSFYESDMVREMQHLRARSEFSDDCDTDDTGSIVGGGNV